MTEPNPFESDIFNRVSVEHPSPKSHIPALRVKERALTGVGMYVDFEYLPDSILRTKLSDNRTDFEDFGG